MLVTIISFLAKLLDSSSNPYQNLLMFFEIPTSSAHFVVAPSSDVVAHKYYFQVFCPLKTALERL